MNEPFVTVRAVSSLMSGGRRFILIPLVILAGFVSVPSAGAKDCGRFIVGEANSTAYPDRELPARGRTSGAKCRTLKRIARRLHDGTYEVPSDAHAPSPQYGPPFSVRDRGRTWSCSLQNRGLSGPSYAIRCHRGAARLRWRTG